MAYRVELTAQAQRDLENLHKRISADASNAAVAWLDELEDAISSLERFPLRCPLAPEKRLSQRGMRHLLFGGKRDVYRILYDIDEVRRIVRIRTVRHGSMDEFVGGK
jgi:toxin ParE1/3/4